MAAKPCTPAPVAFKSDCPITKEGLTDALVQTISISLYDVRIPRPLYPTVGFILSSRPNLLPFVIAASYSLTFAIYGRLKPFLSHSDV